jgi:hypothetical protein
MNPVSQRLLSQQLICPQFATPREVVSWMGAIQAQDHKGMRWAVAMRTKKPSLKAFQKAFNAGEIVRFHLMRGTWQLVAAEDYWPFIELCSPKAIAVTKGWMASNRISISDEELFRIREILCRIVADKRSATKEDIVDGLASRDIRMDDHRLSYHLRMAEFAGVLCSGDLLPMRASYALSADKLPAPAQMDRDEALMLFTRKYFRHSQPATLEDFSWWSGLNLSDCKRGIALLGDWLHTEKWHGREFYLTDAARTRGFRKDRCILLPPYDEYLISYKSRDVVLSLEHRHHAHDQSGTFWPVILLGGQVAGNWTATKDNVIVNPFHQECSLNQESLKAEITRYLNYLSR